MATAVPHVCSTQSLATFGSFDDQRPVNTTKGRENCAVQLYRKEPLLIARTTPQSPRESVPLYTYCTTRVGWYQSFLKRLTSTLPLGQFQDLYLRLNRIQSAIKLLPCHRKYSGERFSHLQPRNPAKSAHFCSQKFNKNIPDSFVISSISTRWRIT
jgi:hypothetical protein